VTIDAALHMVNPPAGPSSTLKVHSNRDKTGVRLTFLGQVGAFRATLQGPSSTNSKDLTLPKLLQANELKSLSFKNYSPPDLKEIGNHENPTEKSQVAVTSHVQYYEMKHMSFVKWLQIAKYENYLQGSTRNVDFVSFHGRIADSLQTPLGGNQYLYKKWQIYGINVAGVIYLWDEKLSPQRPYNQGGFGGSAFEKLVTENPPNGQLVGEMDKVS